MSQDIFIAIQPITGNDVYITPDASTIEEVNVNVQPFSGEEVYINVQPDTGSQLNINMSSSMAGVLLLNGRDGIVTIDKTDVGLSNVENVSITGASGHLQYQIDNLDLNYASQTEIDTLSGYLIQTGQTLNQKIDTFSGTYQDFVNNLDLNYASQTEFNNLSGNLASSGSNLLAQINSLSGAAVLTYGSQTINGIKRFNETVYIKDLFVTGIETIVSTTSVNIGNNYILLNATGITRDAGIFIVTGSELTGANNTGAIIGYDVPAGRWVFGTGTRNSDLSGLQRIASITDLQNYSGFATGRFATIANLATTGSTLQSSINTVSSNLATTGSTLQSSINTVSSNLAITGSSLQASINTLSGNSVLLYGNQNITGVKNFVTKPTVNGSGFVLYGEDRYYQINNLSNIAYQDTTYNVNFDGAGELKGAYASGDVVLNGKTWSIVEGLIGLEAGEILSPPRSLRLRGYGTSQFLLQNPLDYGLYSLSFDYRRYSADTQVSWNVEYDVNQNNTWNNIGNFTAGATTQTFNAIIDVTGKIRVRVVTTAGGTSNRRVNLDNFVFIAASNTVTNPAPGSKFLANTRSGSFVFPLPSNPASGFYYIFTDPFYNWETNNFILSGASVIENDGNLFTGDINGAEMKAIFINQNSGWRII